MAAGGLPGPLPVLRPQSPPLLRSARPLLRYTRRKAPSIAASSPGGEVRKEDVVVVGAGIAGLATAVSLSRLGVRSLVLEQGDSLRTGGTSLTLFKNGWRALDAIGVGDELRPQFLEIQGLALRSDEGRLLRSFLFKDVDASQEVRAVERRVLLETLASQLPNDTICFSSRLKAISRGRTNQTLLELEDGTQLLAKLNPCRHLYRELCNDFGNLRHEKSELKKNILALQDLLIRKGYIRAQKSSSTVEQMHEINTDLVELEPPVETARDETIVIEAWDAVLFAESKLEMIFDDEFAADLLYTIGHDILVSDTWDRVLFIDSDFYHHFYEYCETDEDDVGDACEFT